MGEEVPVCPICGGIHPSGHRDKELEALLKAVRSQLEHCPQIGGTHRFLAGMYAILGNPPDWIADDVEQFVKEKELENKAVLKW